MVASNTTTSDGLIATAIDAGDLMDCADINISDNAADGFIANYINSEDSTDCDEDAAGWLITNINDVDLTDCADIIISVDAEDIFIAADAGNSTYCAGINVSDNDVDELVALATDIMVDDVGINVGETYMLLLSVFV